ncbi:MAG: phospho-N-acetylmuramoyl-pentapeptide-transferase [Deltaproteobacteria bacterium]|nr:phospho-N-acetylmuramoyl-pentapeptide-transferase [Candidatus Anaeroferrophillus wilburensis]MBN2888982.1 phospho-N-acetylmuramoyl-pentapeptide-transferase [Deltaproteobacteria bacterium]
MIYHLLYPLHNLWGIFNVFKYISFRTIYASLTALFLAFYLGPKVIKWLRKLQLGQVIREDGPQSHLDKAGTPTMGGTLILFSVVVSTLLWANLANGYIWLVIMVALSFGFIGFIDDYRKMVHKNAKGLSARKKLGLQLLVGVFFTCCLFFMSSYPSTLMVPFFKRFVPDLGWWYIPFGTLVVVGASNAVNLTDGLDGLATGPSIISFSVYLLFAYLAGNLRLAEYLQITYLPGVGELAIFCGAMVGALLGFLWFNTYPAAIFMGDVGSLALGSCLGAVAVMTKQEMVLLLVGGIFVLETLSVIIQVLSFKLIGKRVFRMAPLHHHFELKGWAEPKVIVRFWIISIMLALLALSTLKLR